ncbi:cupin-like domain-containing protein [Legionella fallonii]|uniref:Transcription factor jumonji jmjC domain-containing protein n=1 Tax=Legionella fallonii LLAP-10 TaxID=1212491 RepID=A0A098G8G5_9GAMM|nr:cupin-like domain-containing protein [Legionella fallonii]CEG58784.1 Transcription factor jumonji jmjC domain-containing protein [Legionella fallonii LLAP-10]
MARLQLEPISRITLSGPDIFQQHYLIPCTPVILTNFSESWLARTKWSFDYFKDCAGDVVIPLYGESFSGTGKNYLEVTTHMNFGDYLDLIATERTHLRMFLFNIFKHIPTLSDDFDFPPIVPSFLEKRPFLFFGGRGSFVDAHYDVNLSHIFLTQFLGKRKVILFAPSESVLLYKHPLTVSTNIDIGDPDFVKYPKLKEAKGMECVLEPYETLFIPSGYWYYVYYVEAGFSLILRSQAIPFTRRMMALLNLFNLLVLDNSISKLIGAQKWYWFKEQMAVKRARRHK